MMSSSKMYNEVELETSITDASNHKLIQLLLDKCLQNMEQAKYAMSTNNIIKKCHFISKAMYIVSYLRACLNFKDKNTADLSNLLNSIYLYIEEQLLEANRFNKIETLTEASRTLATVKSGWDGIEAQTKAQANI